MNTMKDTLTINQMQVKNRLVMPPMATLKSQDGQVSEGLLAYYDEKSKGGYIGLVITEHAYITRQGMANKGQLSMAEDANIEGLKKLTAVIHQNGSKVFAQISHAGSSAHSKETGMPTISASAVLNEGATGRNGEMPLAMTQDDIGNVIELFAAAAARAKEAGFDGVEIHSAHGYLLDQFYSPLTNKRTDAYTGSTLEGRLKLHLEVIKAVREKIGADYPLGIRLGGCDYTEGGAAIEDSVNASILLEKAGIDFLDISGGMNGYINPFSKEQGWFADMTSAIRKKVTVPVILTGGITDIAGADKLLAENAADLIGVGRAILKDSAWAEKMMQV